MGHLTHGHYLEQPGNYANSVDALKKKKEKKKNDALLT